MAEKAGRRLYVQAAHLIVDEATAAPEFGNLERIEDNYPNYVVSMKKNRQSLRDTGKAPKELARGRPHG